MVRAQSGLGDAEPEAAGSMEWQRQAAVSDRLQGGCEGRRGCSGSVAACGCTR